MPYDVNNPPAKIKNLPKKAQRIWVKAFNSAWNGYEDADTDKTREGYAHAVAWSAVKSKYRQNKDGKWVKKDIIEKVIRRCGSKWCLYSKTSGKLLGKHDTKEEAEAQEAAIHANKKTEKVVTSSDIPKLKEKGHIVYGMPGIYLEKPHGTKIIKGEKEAIVKSKRYTNYLNTPLYLLENDNVLGVIKLQAPKKIYVDDFKKYKDKHKISEKERKKWWKGKEELYYYPFELIYTFKEPLKYKKQEETILDSVVFKSADETDEYLKIWREHKRLKDATLKLSDSYEFYQDIIDLAERSGLFVKKHDF